MSEKYIENHFDDIRKFAGIIEDRGDDEGWSIETACRDNAQMLEQCQKHGAEYILVDEEYRIDIEL